MSERVPFPDEIVYMEVLPAIDKVFHSVAYHYHSDLANECDRASRRMKELINKYIDERLSSAYVEDETF